MTVGMTVGVTVFGRQMGVPHPDGLTRLVLLPGERGPVGAGVAVYVCHPIEGLIVATGDDLG